MGEAITFTAEEQKAILAEQTEEYRKWQNLDEGSLRADMNALIGRINEVTKLLDNVVSNRNYDETESAFESLYVNDLGPGGWVQNFYNLNWKDLGEYRDKGYVPPWYGNLPADQKKAFDAALSYFQDAYHVIKPMNEIRDNMTLLPLEMSYKLMRAYMNFEDAGFSEDMFHEINDDVSRVSELLNKSWSYMENQAMRAKEYYQQNAGRVSPDQLKSGYRQARIRDYQTLVEAYKLDRHFLKRSDGTFSVDSSWMADMKVIDKYTLQVSIVINISDVLKKILEAVQKISASLNESWKQVKENRFLSLVEALSNLNIAINSYCEAALNVWTNFKDRDNDAPYCFVKVLPAYSSFQSAYGFEAYTADPWQYGSNYYKIYQSAVSALNSHSQKFISVFPE